MPLIQGNADIADRKTNPTVWTKNPTKLCRPGDIILSVRAPVGSVAHSIHYGCIGRGVCAVRIDNSIGSEFIYQVLISLERCGWKNIEQGSTFSAINREDVRNFRVPLPTLEEQRLIAGFLQAIDAKIDATERTLEGLKEFKRGLLQQMFV